jgi:cell division protein FtsB
MAEIEPSQMIHLTLLLQVLGGMSSLTAASAAILSWRTIRISAKAATSSAETAVYNARHAELQRLHQQFEDGAYFMKLWQLELACGEKALNADAALRELLGGEPLAPQEVRYRLLPFSAEDDAGRVYVQPYLERLGGRGPEAVELFRELFREHVLRYDAADVLRESFGPPYSTTSADLLGVYSLVRALAAWVDNHAAEDREERISEITDVFRRELVLTLARHRAFVSRLFRGTPSDAAFEYFREHYGLRDDEYTWLFEELALDADRKGLLTGEHRDAIARLESWLYVTPARDALRPDPFPRPDWIGEAPAGGGAEGERREARAVSAG